jgi:DNA replication protein DnaC
MDIMGIIASGKNTDAQIAALKNRNEKLLEERGKILREGGYPEDYSDIKYDCEKCGDTGYVGTTMCECMKRALVMAGYESSGLGALIRSQSFENFSLEYYRSGGGNILQMEHFKNNLKRFSENFDSNTYQNYLFMGNTGLGKTHLSTAVAKKVIDRGYDVLYVTSVGMISDFESVRFGDGSRAKHDIDRYTSADLLIIDDLGTEMVNQFTMSCVYDVINERINARRSTIISTNLSSKDIEAKYNERIYSRLIGEYFPVLFTGTDIRRQKILK